MQNNENKKEISFRVQKEMDGKTGGKFTKYCELIVGKKDFLYFLKFELIMFFSSILPGAIGIFLRSKLYPLILKKCGSGVVFGSHIVFRHPLKIQIGDNVIIDDNCMLDAKGSDNNGIIIGNNVFIGRNTILSSKNGDIILEDDVNIGFNSYIFSGNKVRIGKKSLIAAYCYFIGGDHGAKEINKDFYDQDCSAHGIDVEENCWFGADAKIQDNVKIGNNSIIGTGAVVTKDIKEYSIAVGMPAKIIRDRRDS